MIRWSASKIKSATTCAHMIFLRYLKKVQDQMSVPLAAGLYIHSGCEKFNNPKLKRRNFKSSESYANSRVGTWKSFVASKGVYAGQEIEESFDGEIWAAAEGIIKPCSQSFYETFCGREKPIASERKFTLSAGDFRITGGIDCIDPNLVYWDFKSGWGDNPPTKETLQNDYQFTIYSAALPLILASDPVLASLSDLTDAQRKALRVDPLSLMEEVEGRYFHLKSGIFVPTRRTKSDLIDLLNTIEAQSIRFEQGDFTRSKGKHCDWCHVRDACHAETLEDEIEFRNIKKENDGSLLFPPRRDLTFYTGVPSNTRLVSKPSRRKKKLQEPNLFD